MTNDAVGRTACVLLAAFALACGATERTSASGTTSSSTASGATSSSTASGTTGGEPGGDFVTRWSVAEEDRSITLPLIDSGSYDFAVDWGDATSDTITSRSDRAATHVYAAAGSYLVTISGTVQGWAFVNDCKEYCPQFGGCSLECTSEPALPSTETFRAGTRPA